MSSTWTTSHLVDNDPNFRAVAEGFSDKFAANGWVRYPQSGEVTGNWSSATRQPAATSSVWEVFAFDDALQSTVPIYMKVRYGYMSTSGGLTSSFAATMELGSELDGSGGFVGPTSTVTTYISNFAVSNGSYSHAMSSDGSGWTWGGLLDGNANQRFLIVIDRYRDASGAPVDLGWYVMKVLGTSNTERVIANMDPEVGQIHSSRILPMIARGDLGSLVSSQKENGESMMYPLWPTNRQGTFNSKMVLGFNVNDIPVGETFEVPFLGDDREYNPLGPGFIGFSMSTESSVGPAIWWGDL